MTDGVTYSGAGLSVIDGKGRVTMPAQIRSSVEQSSRTNTLFLSLHPTLPCLIGYGVAERERAREDLEFQWRSAVERGEHFDRDAAGAVAASEMTVNFESNGRFVMPPMLRAMAGLDDRALFYGSTWYFCIWNPEMLVAEADVPAIPKRIAQHFLNEAGQKEGGKAK